VQSDVDDVDERWVRALRQDVMDANIPLNVKVVERQINLCDIMGLEAGDIIPVDMPENVTLLANNVPTFKCKLGRSGENLALKIVEQVKLQR